MKHQVDWNMVIYDEFCRLAMLNDFEKRVLKMRIQEYTITEMCEAEHCGRTKITDTIAILKAKYDAVQPLSDILPVRRTSEKERYMDNN